MAALPFIAMGAGTLLQTAATLREGAIAQQVGEFNAQSAENNAKMSEYQSREEERRLRVQAKKDIGDARAQIGASGVQLEGSPLDVLQKSASDAELDALTLRHAGAVRAQSFRSQAGLERAQGRNARIGSYLSASGNLLRGAGGMATAGSGSAA